MKYRIEIEKPAEKFIMKLPKPERERIIRAISGLPQNGDIKQLKGRKAAASTGSVWETTA